MLQTVRLCASITHDVCVTATRCAGYKNWVNQSQPTTLTFYVFNITNPDRILAGDKPIVAEVRGTM